MFSDGGTIPVATWDPASNCIITGITSEQVFTVAPGGQTFGNFIWNCGSQNQIFSLNQILQLPGNFSVIGTGTYDQPNHSLRMSNTGTGYLITVGGNVLIDGNATFKMNNGGGSCTLNIGGNLSINSGNFTIVTGTVNSTVNVTGNVNIAGGTLNMKEDLNATVGTLNVKGNFTMSGSSTITLLDGPLGTGSIVFNGTTPQTYSKTGGTVSNNINYTVNPGAILDVGTSLIDGSSGAFTLSAGAGIITGHAQGLSTTAGTGSIQLTGAKTFDAAADYTYDGASGQITGNALPASVHNLTFNNSGDVTLTNGVSVGNLLTMTSGNIFTGANTLILTPFNSRIIGSNLRHNYWQI